MPNAPLVMGKREHPNAGCSLGYGLMWMAYASSSAAQSILV